VCVSTTLEVAQPMNITRADPAVAAQKAGKRASRSQGSTSQSRMQQRCAPTRTCNSPTQGRTESQQSAHAATGAPQGGKNGEANLAAFRVRPVRGGLKPPTKEKVPASLQKLGKVSDHFARPGSATFQGQGHTHHIFNLGILEDRRPAPEGLSPALALDFYPGGLFAKRRPCRLATPRRR